MHRTSFYKLKLEGYEDNWRPWVVACPCSKQTKTTSCQQKDSRGWKFICYENEPEKTSSWALKINNVAQKVYHGVNPIEDYHLTTTSNASQSFEKGFAWEEKSPMHSTY